MAPTTPLRSKSNATANLKSPEPWSRSTPQRFGGYGSHYKKNLAGTPGESPRGTKHSTSAANERFATPDERVNLTPGRAVKPSASFVSATDRFCLPSSHVVATAAPGVGTYDAKKEEARVRGAVKLQAAIRRRQSRGIFAQSAAEAEAATRPAPGENQVLDLDTSGPAAKAAFRKPTAHGRFSDMGCVYGTNIPGCDLPGVGDYTPALPSVSEISGSGQPSAAFRGADDRFDGHGSIYTMPASSEDSKLAHERAVEANRLLFGDASALPAPNHASFASTTDRFALPTSHITTTAAPGVGTYDPNDESHIIGAVSLGKDKRQIDRQSRGIFAQIEAEASQVPGCDVYQPELYPAHLQPNNNNSKTATIAASVKTAVSLPVTTEEEDAEVVEAPVVPGGVRFSLDENELAASPVVREPPKGQRLSKVVSLDTWLGESDDEDDDDAPPPPPPTSTIWGPLEPIGTIDEEENESGRQSLQSVLSDAADGDWLFSQLERMMSTSEVTKEDYWTEDGGWDLDGLREDIKLYMKQGASEIC